MKMSLKSRSSKDKTSPGDDAVVVAEQGRCLGAANHQPHFAVARGQAIILVKLDTLYLDTWTATSQIAKTSSHGPT